MTIASLKAAFYGIGNGGAGQVHPYNEKMVLLKSALREIFRVARYMRCHVAGEACRFETSCD